MKMTGRLHGLEGLRRTLLRIADEASLRDAIRDSAEDVREAARANLRDGQPPDGRSGALAGSLSVEMTDSGQSAYIGTGLDYGWHLEFGSLTRPPTPWLEPALDAARPGILARLRYRLAASGKR
jgi:hypothetical protein